MSIKSLSRNRSLLFAFSFLTFYGITSSAQVLQTQRYEIPLGNLDQPYDVTPADNHGIFLHRELIVNTNAALEILRLDTAFHQKWRGYLPIDANLRIARKQYYDTTLYLLLNHYNAIKNDLQIIAIQPANGSFIQYDLKNFIPLRLVDFQVTKVAALIAGYYNNIPVIIYYDFHTRQSKIVPGLFNEQGELTQVKTYADGSFDVLVSTRTTTKKKSILVRNYDLTGKLLKSVMLQPGPDKNLLFGRSIKTSNGKDVIAGTYSNFIADISKGIFTASIDANDDQDILYYNYGDLHNFFHFMSARREARIKTRIARKKIKGKKLRFNYRLLVHEIVPYHNQYILVGEAFYPHYSYPNSSYGLVYSSRYAVFDGYYYTHAIVVCFDRNGKLVWDNSFEISDVRTFNLTQFVKIDTRPDKISILYLFNNKLRSKVIRGDSLLEDDHSKPLTLINDDDRQKKTEIGMSKLEYWFQHYFVAYGTERITDRKDDMQRKVFVLSKVKSN